MPGESNEKKAIRPHRVPGGKLILHLVIVMLVMVVVVDDALTVVDLSTVQGFADRRTGIRDRGGRGRRDALRFRRRPAYDGRRRLREHDSFTKMKLTTTTTTILRKNVMKDCTTNSMNFTINDVDSKRQAPSSRRGVVEIKLREMASMVSQRVDLPPAKC